MVILPRANISATIQNHNGHSVSNSFQFFKETTDVDIQDEETMVSFDIVSLLTGIPVDKTCIYTRKKLENGPSLYSSHFRTNVGIEDIVSLLNFVLSNSYFVYKDNIYKPIHGCAMGSPVTVPW